jgi:predicted Zn-dependent peptidase
MEIQQITLPNGLRLVHSPSPSAVAHCAVFLNTGSRDEGEEESGLAHFIEHILFKGTRKRRAYHILSRLENVGGDLNAYTSKEETCIYASFLPEHLERSLDLFADILFHSTFPDKEIIREKEIIQDEINAYLDTPFEQIFDDFEMQLFDGHPLGRHILGSRESLRHFGKEAVLAFIRRNYRNEGTVICTMGPAPFSRVKRIVSKHFGEIPWGNAERPRLGVNGYVPSQKSIERQGYQSHCILGSRAYPLGHRGQWSLTLLSNLLGGPGMNSRLNLSIREKSGLAYHTESSYHPYSDTGVFEMYLGTDRDSVEKVIQLALKECSLLRNQKLGTLQLQRARQQLKGQVAIASESKLNLLLSMGKSLLLKNHILPLEEIYREIDAVDASSILEVANEICSPEQMSSLVFKTPQR